MSSQGAALNTNKAYMEVSRFIYMFNKMTKKLQCLRGEHDVYFIIIIVCILTL